MMSFSCFAQLSEGRYASRMTQDGTIFFINPHKLKKTSGIKRFEYDMTLLTWTDSVTINFTFESDLMAIPHDIKISSGDKSFVCNNFKPLFVDIKKKHYEIRISAIFPIQDLEYILNSSFPLCFEFYQEGNKETAAYSPGSWKKDRDKLMNIYNLYKYRK